MPKRRIHYVLSTHWDREWYQPFQDYRHRLVHLMDGILDGLADGRLQGPFQADGQVILLEDYLEVRPERRTQVEQFLRERKLVAGPWYGLPDEFLVSGESLVRNLRLGREMVRAVGAKPSSAGFACDMFGHNSQLPQILKGFDIPAGFVWRGINLIEKRHFLWQGADGTVLPCYRFGHGGYGSYSSAVRRAADQHHAFDHAAALEALERFIQSEAEHTETAPILLFDGCDHQEWEEEIYRVLLERAQRDDTYDIVHTSLDDYAAEMLDEVSQITERWEGELREPGLLPREIDQQWLIPGVLSSRVNVKQSNAECETLLCRWAEPLGALAHSAVGAEYPEGFLRVAWRWLLQNHPHDSICGCSVDQVHEDMQYRFSQCRQIGQRLAIEATRQIGASVEGEVSADDLRVVVFNPQPVPVDEVAELSLEIPSDWPTFNEFFGFEPKPTFRMYDAEDREVPYQRLGQAMRQRKFRVYPVRYPRSYETNDVRVALPLRLPALGYITLTVRRGEAAIPTRHPDVPGLATSERSLENELLALVIQENGTLTLTDKRTGETYSRLLTFEDTGDIGDGWYHGVATNDQTFFSTGCRSQVALVHNGPFLTTFRVRTTMSVPAEFEFDRMGRSERLQDLAVDSLITLRASADWVEVKTTVANDVDDHRLRVLFPTGARTDVYLADGIFDVVERQIALRQDNYLYREIEVETRPMQSWTAVADGERGLAVISSGQMESAVRDLPERPLALTLFRGTRRTVFSNGEPGGQLRGSLTFHYWIAPLQGSPDRARLSRLGQRLASGIRSAQLRSEDVALYRGTASLPASASFLRLEGPAVITSVREVDGALEVRLFNPNAEPIQASLDLSGRPASSTSPATAQRVNLESRPLEEARPIVDARVALSLRPKEIATLRVR